MNLNQRIAEIVPKMGGWCSIEKGQELALAVLKLKAKLVIELGVFEGRSLLPMAMALKEQGSGIIWGVDPWNNQDAKEGYDGVNAEWWGTVDLEGVYQRFLGHIKKAGVEEQVRIFRRKSDDIVPPPVIDLVHLDALHTDQAVKDVERFAPKIRVGGYLFADDITWQGGGVARAVEKLLTMGFVKIFDRDTGAMFERKPISQKGVPKKRKKKAAK